MAVRFALPDFSEAPLETRKVVKMRYFALFLMLVSLCVFTVGSGCGAPDPAPTPPPQIDETENDEFGEEEPEDDPGELMGEPEDPVID